MKLWAPVLLALLLAGCGPSRVGDEKSNPAPSAPVTKPIARSDAMYWATRYPDRMWGPVSATGSMVPMLDSNSIVLLVRYTGQPLRKGMVARFDRGDLPNVLHRIEDVNTTHVFISGLNVSRADGWIPKTEVSAILAGLFYTDVE